jgi:hypothetical protein
MLLHGNRDGVSPCRSKTVQDTVGGSLPRVPKESMNAVAGRMRKVNVRCAAFFATLALVPSGLVTGSVVPSKLEVPRLAAAGSEGSYSAPTTTTLTVSNFHGGLVDGLPTFDWVWTATVAASGDPAPRAATGWIDFVLSDDTTVLANFYAYYSSASRPAVCALQTQVTLSQMIYPECESGGVTSVQLTGAQVSSPALALRARFVGSDHSGPSCSAPINPDTVPVYSPVISAPSDGSCPSWLPPPCPSGTVTGVIASETSPGAQGNFEVTARIANQTTAAIRVTGWMPSDLATIQAVLAVLSNSNEPDQWNDHPALVRQGESLTDTVAANFNSVTEPPSSQNSLMVLWEFASPEFADCQGAPDATGTPQPFIRPGQRTSSPTVPIRRQEQRVVVLSARASPQVLGPAGGTVVVAGSVRAARTCQLQLLSQHDFSVIYATNPRPCGDGTFSAHLVIGANRALHSREIVFALVARNGDSVSRGRFYISMGGAVPAVVSSVSVTPRAVGMAGGTVQVTAQVEGAVTCQLKMLTAQSFPVVYATNVRPCAGGTFSAKVIVGARGEQPKPSIPLVLLVRNSISTSSRSFYIMLTNVSIEPKHLTTSSSCPSGTVTGAIVRQSWTDDVGDVSVTVKVTNGTSAAVQVLDWSISDPDMVVFSDENWMNSPPTIPAGDSITDTESGITTDSYLPPPSRDHVSVDWSFAWSKFSGCGAP